MWTTLWKTVNLFQGHMYNTCTVRNDVCWHMHTSDITCDIYVHCCFCINDNVCTELHPLCTFLQNNKQWRCCFNWVPLLFWSFMPHVWQNKAREFTEFLCKLFNPFIFLSSEAQKSTLQNVKRGTYNLGVLFFLNISKKVTTANQRKILLQLQPMLFYVKEVLMTIFQSADTQ